MLWPKEEAFILLMIKKKGIGNYLSRGQIEDFNKVIEINPKFGEAYYNRGVAKLGLGQKDSGCLDLSKARELGFDKAYESIKKLCNP